MAKDKVLITGIAGLVGSHFSEYLLDRNYDVYGIDDLSGGYKENIPDKILSNGNFSKINLVNYPDVEKIFHKIKPDYVYHFAAYAAEGLSPFIRNFNYQNNILASINVINECINHDVKKIIFTSSMATYGTNSTPYIETQIPHPIDPYGIAKYAVEMDLKQAYKQFDLNYVIIKPHNIVGPRQNIWDRYRNVIGIWIYRILNNKNILIYGDGEQRRAFSDIKYYMEPFKKLMSNYTDEIFNLGADKDYSIKEAAFILKKIAEKYGYYTKIEYKEPRHEIKIAYTNHDKAKKLLNFKDNTILEKLIEDMFLWAIDQTNKPQKNMRYEVNKNLYSFWK